MVTTGKEIAEGRVEDAFADKFRGKETFKGELIGQRFCTDDASLIAAAIRAFLNEGAQLVVCTGGMSVDADDRTRGRSARWPLASPSKGFLLPGAMALLGWVEQEGQEPRALIGALACVVHDERTALDRLLPYVFAGVDPGIPGLALGCRRFVRAVPRLPLGRPVPLPPMNRLQGAR